MNIYTKTGELKYASDHGKVSDNIRRRFLANNTTDFTTMRLSGEVLESVILTSCDLSGSRFENCEFVYCEFTACNFLRCEFVNCKFVDCKLVDCDFSMSSFGDVEFTCTVLDAKLADCVGLNSVSDIKSIGTLSISCHPYKDEIWIGCTAKTLEELKNIEVRDVKEYISYTFFNEHVATLRKFIEDYEACTVNDNQKGK